MKIKNITLFTLILITFISCNITVKTLVTKKHLSGDFYLGYNRSYSNSIWEKSVDTNYFRLVKEGGFNNVFYDEEAIIAERNKKFFLIYVKATSRKEMFYKSLGYNQLITLMNNLNLSDELISQVKSAYNSN